MYGFAEKIADVKELVKALYGFTKEIVGINFDFVVTCLYTCDVCQ